MRVGHIVATLKAVRRQHLMVAEDGGRRVRGLFSASPGRAPAGRGAADVRGRADVRGDRGRARAAERSAMRDRYREIYRGVPLGRSGALQHRAVGLPALGGGSRARRAALGRRVGRAARAHLSRDPAATANRLSNALAALGVARGDRVGAHPAAAARDRRRLPRLLPDGRDRGAAVVPLRARGARVPARRQRREGRDRRSA